MIIVYGRKDCKHCDELVAILDETGLDYKYIDINETPSAKNVLIIRGLATVPQTFNQDIHIGGKTDTIAWIKRSMPAGITLSGGIRTGNGE